jgi:hypothetical protein
LIDKFRDEFGLDAVEGKQRIRGLCSGTGWEIEAKGVREGRVGFIVIECRRYTTSRLDQESVGGLAYRILDTGAIGGIIVSPLGLQEGAKKVASAANVIEVRLDENSTPYDYMLSFLNKTMVGVCVELAVALHEVARITIMN